MKGKWGVGSVGRRESEELKENEGRGEESEG